MRAIKWVLRRNTAIDATQRILTEKLIAIALFVFAMLFGIDLLGIDLTALAVFSGAAGLAIGFGLQKTVGNLIAGIILPFLYGSWRFTIYHFLVGPRLAMLLTDNPNEVAAIWFLLSIGILIIVVKTPVRHLMPVKRWPLWFGLNPPREEKRDDESAQNEGGDYSGTQASAE